MRLTRAIKSLQIVNPVDVPVPDFILFGVEVFLAPGLARGDSAQLKGRAIDAITCPQRCRQDQPTYKSRAPAEL